MFVLLAAMFACSISGPLRTDPKALEYKTGSLSADWLKQNDDEKESSADEIYLNAKTSAFLSMDSMCRRYPDSSLESLSRQLLVPMTESVMQSQEKITLDGREGLMTKVSGTLDGVAVEAQFVVVRKNECIFDFSLVSRNSILPDDATAFRRYYEGFKYLGGVKE